MLPSELLIEAAETTIQGESLLALQLLRLLVKGKANPDIAVMAMYYLDPFVPSDEEEIVIWSSSTNVRGLALCFAAASAQSEGE